MWKPDLDMLVEMKKFLLSRLIGQNEAIEEIMNLFAARAVRSPDDRRPFMSLFLNGTSGVGKTLIFELIGEFLNSDKGYGRTNVRIPVTKIALNGLFAFELIEAVSWLGSSARNPGDSKRSKFEILFEQALESDPMFGRQIIILDEFDKLGPSYHWNEKIALNSLEILDDATPSPKHSDAIPIDLGNTLLIITGNYFLNSVVDPKRSIGFAIPDGDITLAESEHRNIDKAEVIEKMRRHFSISAFQRLDKVIVFNDLSGHWDMRKDFAEKEIEKMFRIIDKFYIDRGNPLPAIEQYGDKKSLVSEALENADPDGWFRAIKRYIQNSMMGRILSLLHNDYPNRQRVLLTKRGVNKGKITSSGSENRASDEDAKISEAFEMTEPSIPF